MKVILLIDIPKIGNRDDVLELKQGFAQNVLLSKGKAILATPQALASLASKKANQQKIKEQENKDFASLIANINNKQIIIKAKSNEKGVLFKAVGPKDVALSIKEMVGLQIDENLIDMEHIKNLGNHFIFIKKGETRGKCEIIVEAI